MIKSLRFLAIGRIPNQCSYAFFDINLFFVNQLNALYMYTRV